jgi:mono/diheme cytochrome c family protein|tara:strand:- start:471 stop:779 length:309 start_codon:yes stop_codon:yes gene_type:complete
MKYYNYFISAIFILFSQILCADEILDLGKNIFLEKGNCATCHTLSDAGSTGDIGPNLNEIKPDVGRVVLAVTNGIGVMPAYEGVLTSEEIEAVAKYVSEKSN